MIDTLRLTAEEATGLLERGEVTAAELHRAYLDAVAERDPEIHAYLRTVEDGADQATGVPIALKDLISTKGVETTAASKILAGYRPVYDATVAERCKQAGLGLLGKTNMDEFAMGSSTENSAFGPTPEPLGSRPASPAARPAAPPPPSRPASHRGRSAPTPGARSSSRPPSAASSACAPPTARSPATGSSPSRRASTRSGRSRRPSATARASTRSSPAAIRRTRPPSSCPSPSSFPRPRT